MPIGRLEVDHFTDIEAAVLNCVDRNDPFYGLHLESVEGAKYFWFIENTRTAVNTQQGR